MILSLEEAVLRPGEHSLFLQPLFGFMLQIAYDEGDDSSSLRQLFTAAYRAMMLI